MRKPRKIVVKPDKICNNCGEMVDKYSIIDNGIFCTDCFPTLEKPKKIPSESTMLNTLLKYNERNPTDTTKKD